MADNVDITPGTGATVAADEVGGALYQRVKVAVGADGAAADLAPGQAAMAASLPVVIASDQGAVPVSDGGGALTVDGTVAVSGSVAVTGPLTDAALRATPVPVSGTFYQATQPVSGTVTIQDGGGAITVDGTVAATGPLTDAELRAADVKVTLDSEQVAISNFPASQAVTGTFWQATQPVSAAALPLPAGAATEASLASVKTAVELIDNAIAGSEMQVDLVSAAQLPAALAANGGLKIEGVAGGVAVPVSGTVAVTGAGGVSAASVSVTPVCEAAAYHSGDVLFDSVEIANAARANGTGVELVSLVARDKDDQAAAAMTLYFFNANTSLGTKNAAPDIDDTEIDTLVGMLTIPASAWVDVGASKVAVMPNVGLLMHPGGASTSLYVAATTAGTPTQTASGITLTLNFVRY